MSRTTRAATRKRRTSKLDRVTRRVRRAIRAREIGRRGA